MPCQYRGPSDRTPSRVSIHARNLKGYPESTLTLDFARLERLGEWTPTETQPAVRIMTDHGSVLVAAKGANVSIRTKGPGTVVVGRADEGDGIGAVGGSDAVGVEGPVSVVIETTTWTLEAVQLDGFVAPSIQIGIMGSLETLRVLLAWTVSAAS